MFAAESRGPQGCHGYALALPRQQSTGFAVGGARGVVHRVTRALGSRRGPFRRPVSGSAAVWFIGHPPAAPRLSLSVHTRTCRQYGDSAAPSESARSWDRPFGTGTKRRDGRAGSQGAWRVIPRSASTCLSLYALSVVVGPAVASCLVFASTEGPQACGCVADRGRVCLSLLPPSAGCCVRCLSSLELWNPRVTCLSRMRAVAAAVRVRECR